MRQTYLVSVQGLEDFGYLYFSTSTNYVQKPYNGSSQEHNHFHPARNLISGGSSFYFEGLGKNRKLQVWIVVMTVQ
ncbi:MAG: hypothetical protein CM15mP83_8100 [Flavobacteriaceae bacterium]|nr:MAG: hypothetical protein CM15mP83_8100 [Flavobacteriaceae bacterium]